MKKLIFVLFFAFAFAAAFADVDMYSLDSPTAAKAYLHKKLWSPLERDFDTDSPLILVFYAPVYHGFIWTFDTKLYLNASFVTTEGAKNLFIKNVRVQDEKGKTYFNLYIDRKFEIPELTDESLLYNKDGTAFEVDGKPLHFFSFDLGETVSGWKVGGRKTQKMKVTLRYDIDETTYTSELDYLCKPHSFGMDDLVTLFAVP